MQNRTQQEFKEILLKNEFNWELLSENRSDKAVDIVIKHIIDYNLGKDEIPSSFYSNTNDKVIEFFEQNKDKVDWRLFSLNKNTKVIDIIIKYIKTDNNINNVNLGALFAKGSIQSFVIIKLNFEKLEHHHFDDLLINKKLDDNVNTFIINKFEKIKQKYINLDIDIFWDSLSANNSAKIIEILRKYPRRINWNIFVKNTSNEAIDVILENEEYLLNLDEYKDFWKTISSNSNPRILEFLEKNKTKLDISVVVQNPLFVKFSNKPLSYKSI